MEEGSYPHRSVFPARAGMSPGVLIPPNPPLSVPRASGDEPPLCVRAENGAGCSPRERG